MKIKGGEILGSLRLLVVDKPDGDMNAQFVLNGHLAVPPQAVGTCYRDISVAKYSGTPDVGVPVGPKDGQWDLYEDGAPYFECAGPISDGIGYAIPSCRGFTRNGILDEDLTAGGGPVMVSLHDADEVDTGFDVNADSWPDIALSQGEKVTLHWILNSWYISTGEGGGECKVKVDADDTCAFLEDQFDHYTDDAETPTTDVEVKSNTIDSGGDKLIALYAAMDSISGWDAEANQFLFNNGGSLQWKSLDQIGVERTVGVDLRLQGQWVQMYMVKVRVLEEVEDFGFKEKIITDTCID